MKMMRAEVMQAQFNQKKKLALMILIKPENQKDRDYHKELSFRID